MKPEQIDYCKLCRKLTKLENSHAIPKAVFKHIFSYDSTGKAVEINADLSTNTRYSSNSWAEHQLCKSCETRLNTQYDSYGINLLKSTFSQEKNKYGITFTNIDRRKFRLFFLSIMWRSALSSHPNYKNVKLDFAQLETLRSAFYNNNNTAHSNFTVAVYKLENFAKIEGLNSENIRSFVFAPFIESYSAFSSICFIFFGFYIEIFFVKLPKSFMCKPGVLYGNSSIFMAPNREVIDIPIVQNIFLAALNKEDSGMTRIKTTSSG